MLTVSLKQQWGHLCLLLFSWRGCGGTCESVVVPVQLVQENSKRTCNPKSSKDKGVFLLRLWAIDNSTSDSHLTDTGIAYNHSKVLQQQYAQKNIQSGLL